MVGDKFMNYREFFTEQRSVNNASGGYNSNYQILGRSSTICCDINKQMRNKEMVILPLR